MRKRSGQVYSRESSATLQLTVSLLYRVASFRSCFPAGYGKINIKETFSTIKKWTFRKKKRIFRR